jgi:hypothetical protein
MGSIFDTAITFHSDRKNNYNLDESAETVEYVYEK